MKLINRHTLAATAAERWRATYFPSYMSVTVDSTSLNTAAQGFTQWANPYRTPDRRLMDILERLVNLGPHPDPDEVDRIAGDPSWTTVPKCMECEQEVDEVVEMENRETFYLCNRCLLAALELIDS